MSGSTRAANFRVRDVSAVNHSRRKLSDRELAQTSAITLAHYNDHAESFWQGTRDHDVSQNRNALLSSLPGPGPFRILDFGCGPGRDLAAFRDLGHEPIGLDGAERFVELARHYSNLPGFPEARSAGGIFRLRVCQCLVVSRTNPAVAPGPQGALGNTEIGRRSVQFQSPWRKPRRLEWGALRLLLRPRALARACHRRRFHRTQSLLSANRAAVRPTA